MHSREFAGREVPTRVGVVWRLLLPGRGLIIRTLSKASLPWTGKATAFTARLSELENRLLIFSVCKSCDASKLVSEVDDSLREWEENHKCEKLA
jgi:hypothetical protein